MNYKESRLYIEHAQKYGSVLGLNNMEVMMERLGNPQDELQFIHVAGTNGKGSVLAYVSTVLKEAGYQVGRYVSPTLFSYLERIEINGEPVSEEIFAAQMTKVAKVVTEMVKEGLAHPTPFEIETAVAFLCFKELRCQIVALETGMGGLLDATNLITTTQIAVLTSISMDHMGFLGNTLAEIARNKAGIIKPGCHVVTTRQKPEAMTVVEGTARRFKVPVHVADKDDALVEESSCFGQKFLYGEEEYEISMAGVYQIENAVIALKVVEVLRELGYEISGEAIHRGMKETVWGGRFSILDKSPVFVIDGAHNPDAALKLEASIQEYFEGKTIYYIMGMFKDKDYDRVAQIAAPYAKEIMTIATPKNERALPAEELAKTVRKYNSHVTAMQSLQDAVEVAYKKAKPEDVIIAFGSLSFLGEISELVKKRRKTEEK